MSIDLSQFISTFLEESYEGLEIMENGLLNLDSGDHETINTIFRAAHSIKGGAGTFGFDQVGEFTHNVETLLDNLRKERQPVTPAIINLLLESVDAIRALLAATQNGPATDTDQINQLDLRLLQAINGELESTIPASDAEHTQSTAVDETPDAAEPATGPSSEHAGDEQASPGQLSSANWQIYFKPAPTLLQQGHEPWFLLEALQELGDVETEAFTQDIPPLTELDPYTLHLSWQLNLNADCSEAEIREIFEWIEDDCELTILNNADAQQSRTEQTGSGWHISFTPSKQMMQLGHEPVFMLEALQQLGSASISALTDELPALAELNPHELCLRWQIELQSDCDENQIREIFEWVEDDCDLQIIPTGTAVHRQSLETEAQPVATPSDEPEVENSLDTSVKSSSLAKNEPSANKEPSTTAEAVSSVSPKKNTPNRNTEKKNSSTLNRVNTEASSVRVELEKIDILVNRVGELVITQAMLSQIGQDIAEIPSVDTERLMAGLEQLERNTRDLQEDVMRVRMFPISFVFNRFPRLVHDISTKLEKKVELRISGEQTEIDKTVMEKIGDPLVHLIRNALDHGLETPQQRLAMGKPETGTLQLNAYHQSGFFIIDIIDDGRGIDEQKVRQKAIKQGLIAPEQSLSSSEIHDLLFSPGFSTSEQVSDLSGRGVGMDVVRRNIEALGGNIQISSEPGQGTLFSVSLPLTLAIMDGQLIRLHDETYIIPLISIIETILAKESDLSPIAGQHNLLLFRDEYVPLISLHKLFNLPETDQVSSGQLIAIVESAGQKAGLIVDELFGQQQVVIKSLEQNFKRIDGLTGATILGDGSVALILDIAGLIKRGLDYSLTQAAHQRTIVLNKPLEEQV